MKQKITNLSKLKELNKLLNYNLSFNEAFKLTHDICPSKFSNKTETPSLLIEFQQTLYKTYCPTIKINYYAFNIKNWINTMIPLCEDQEKLKKTIFKTCSYPGLITLTSILIIILLCSTYIPNTLKTYENYQLTPPDWTFLIISINEFIKRYFFLITLLLSLVVGILVSRPHNKIFKQFYSLTSPHELSLILNIAGIILDQGNDLKSTIESIELTPKSSLKAPFNQCKKHLLKTGDVQKAFEHLIKNPIELAILKNAILTNKLSHAFFEIAKKNTKNQMNKIKLISRSISVCLLCVTGLTICIGFYISLLPMISILKNIMI